MSSKWTDDDGDAEQDEKEDVVTWWDWHKFGKAILYSSNFLFQPYSNTPFITTDAKNLTHTGLQIPSVDMGEINSVFISSLPLIFQCQVCPFQREMNMKKRMKCIHKLTY